MSWLPIMTKAWRESRRNEKQHQWGTKKTARGSLTAWIYIIEKRPRYFKRFTDIFSKSLLFSLPDCLKNPHKQFETKLHLIRKHYKSTIKTVEVGNHLLPMLASKTFPRWFLFIALNSKPRLLKNSTTSSNSKSDR